MNSTIWFAAPIARNRVVTVPTDPLYAYGWVPNECSARCSTRWETPAVASDSLDRPTANIRHAWTGPGIGVTGHTTLTPSTSPHWSLCASNASSVTDSTPQAPSPFDPTGTIRSSLPRDASHVRRGQVGGGTLMGVTIDDARAVAAMLPRSYEALVRDR